MKKHIYLTIDTETAGSLDNPIVYDLGGCIHDRQGNVIETFSFVIKDTFMNATLMETAYYKDKISDYRKDLAEGKRTMVTFTQAYFYVKKLCSDYEVRAIIAHNARFDVMALNNTQRYLSDGKYRYFLPYGIEIWCSMKMARQTIASTKKYKNWCKEHDYVTSRNVPRVTAEVLYRYITDNHDFIESHTGLEDVLIEKEITTACFNTHKRLDKRVLYKAPKKD